MNYVPNNPYLNEYKQPQMVIQPENGLTLDLKQISAYATNNVNSKEPLYATKHGMQVFHFVILGGNGISGELYPDVDQFIMIMSGCAMIRIGNQNYNAGPLSAVVIPAGVVGSISNTSSEILKYYVIYSKGVLNNEYKLNQPPSPNYPPNTKMVPTKPMQSPQMFQQPIPNPQMFQQPIPPQQMYPYGNPMTQPTGFPPNMMPNTFPSTLPSGFPSGVPPGFQPNMMPTGFPQGMMSNFRT